MKPSLFCGPALCTLSLLVPSSGFGQPSDPASGVQLSGYVSASYFHATEPDGHTITGRLYDRFSDEFGVNAARLTLRRSVAADRQEAGFQVDLLYGQNAPPVRSTGLSLGDQGDLPQAFVMLNLPMGEDRYMRFAAGKRWTMMDVEYLDEVLNPNYSHGYAYIYLSNFTDVGLSLEAKLSSVVEADVRLINGWDVVEDNNKARSVMARVGITPSDRMALSFLGGAGPERADNVHDLRSVGQFVGTFKATQGITIDTELDAGSEEGLAADGGTATWWGASLWGVFDAWPTASLALRGEYFDDADGARTSGVLGFPVADSRQLRSITATLNIKSWDHALVRPEVRFEHSSRDDFGGGTEADQLTMGLAMSYLF